MMDVILLGTGSPIPDPNRAGPATLVRAGGLNLLVDAGRGVLMRLGAAGVGANTLSAVLLTHLHSDHLTDLNDVITSRWVLSMEPAPLPIIGPPGTADVVAAIMESLRSDIGYRIAHHDDLTWEPQLEITEVSKGLALESGSVRVTAAPTDHRPVEPSIAFRVDADGQSVVIAGDTVPCATLDELCLGADVLVHTALRHDILATVPVQRLQDILDYHSSVEQCAQTAARAGVSTLMLTHYVPAPQPGTEDEWRKLAAAHFDGRIEVGDDLLRVELAPVSD
ncbi:MAG TPA: ribonuclease Z [Microthrixaceae bacterium]|nr:ribonuclease Z [Microthrixaceae bacterium]